MCLQHIISRLSWATGQLVQDPGEESPDDENNAGDKPSKPTADLAKELQLAFEHVSSGNYRSTKVLLWRPPIGPKDRLSEYDDVLRVYAKTAEQQSTAG